MPWLITTDPHLSDKPKDKHRFGLFKWLAEQQIKHDVEATFVLGDLTQEKDKHSSALVNRVIDEITLLKPPIYILRGNHDCLSPDNPFFRFLNCIEGVHFFVNPGFIPDSGVAMIPHCRTQQELDQAVKASPQECYVMLHTTFQGAISETGSPLSGLRASPIELLKPRAVWSGDVHKPQRAGIVTYVGSPYHVRFGDQFEPRVILYKNNKEQNLYFPAPRKLALTVRNQDDLKVIKKGDQVKLHIEMKREDITDWPNQKQRLISVAKELGAEVFGVDLTVLGGSEIKTKAMKHRDNKQILKDFSKSEGLPADLEEVGLAFLEV